MILLFIFLLSLLHIGPQALASEATQANLRIRVDESMHFIDGEITVKSSKPHVCFYLPYNDPSYGDEVEVSNRMEFHQDPFRKSKGELGWIEIDGHLREQIIQRPTSNGVATLKFKSRVANSQEDQYNQWFYHGFHPTPLTSCQSDTPKKATTSYNVSLEHPRGWDYLGIGSNPGSFQYKGESFSFALISNMHKSHVDIEGVNVYVYYKSERFLKLVPSLRAALQKYKSWFGAFPYASLHFIEANKLERNDLPGVVAIDRPRQATLSEIQTDWLNWAHWITFTTVAKQWYGAAIRVSEPKDHWLIKGITEMVTLEALKEYGVRYNIYNSVDTGTNLIELDYRELLDVGASLLFQVEPDLRLTDKNFDTKVDFVHQHSMIPIRHSMAMRSIKAAIGLEAFKNFMKSLTTAYLHEVMGPSQFATHIEASSLEEEQKRIFKRMLKDWWTKPGWPDYELSVREVARVDGGWKTSITISQLGHIGGPVEVSLLDQDGVEVTQKANFFKESSRLEFFSTGEPEDIEIDRHRQLYDSNRFNNSSQWPDLNFLPGSVRGLKDDAYTVLWAPYPFRRPGQPWSLGLKLGLFRYINSATTASLETEIGDQHRSAFSIGQSFNAPSLGLKTVVDGSQDIFGSRLLQATITKGPLIPVGPHISLFTAARHRQVVGNRDSKHQTGAIGFQAKNRGQHQYLGFHVIGEYESAPPATSSNFSYDRRILIANLFLRWPNIADHAVRFFRGELAGSNDIPNELRFYPEDLQAARLRLDMDNLERSDKIYSVDNDLFFPLSLPIGGSTFILSKRLKGRAFYDLGRALDLNTDYRAAGLGLHLPLGGDITGIGSLALTRFTLLTVLYSRVNQRVSTVPRLLFSFGGAL